MAVLAFALWIVLALIVWSSVWFVVRVLTVMIRRIRDDAKRSKNSVDKWI